METSLTPSESWSTVNKIAFRFFVVFFTLLFFPFPLNYIPGVEDLFSFYDDFWTWMINLVAPIFLGIEEKLEPRITGSGDSLYSWAYYFTVLLVSIAISGIWSLLDRKRANYNQLRPWFLLVLSYYLASVLFVYGIIKVFYLQFSPPNLERLFQTFGQASPMRMLWTFMGSSESYTVFSGWSETIAGLLLVFRRTRTLGALVAFGVMLNVFLLNMSYDVPVKLYSFQLLLMALYIALQDHRRLLNFFVLNRTAHPADHSLPISSKRGKYILLGVQAILIAYLLYFNIDRSMESQSRYGSKRQKSPLYGIYNVTTFVNNQDTLPPLLTDTLRWRRVLMDYPRFISVVGMKNKVQRYQSQIDTSARTMVLHIAQDTVNKFTFTYERRGKDLSLAGIIHSDTLAVELKHYPLERMGLLNRGFHWVNEVPYNRYNYDAEFN